MTTKRLRILVLTCSTRPGALGPAVGGWLTETLTPVAKGLDVDLVPVAIGDLDLPFLDEEEHPSTGVHHHEHTRRWSRIVDDADGFVFVTPEYNYGMPATLKNALDYLGPEWAWKPAGFVSYGHTSAGTRAVQHAKQVVTTLRLVPLGSTVAIRIADAMREDRFLPEARHADAAEGLLAELVRVAQALTPCVSANVPTPWRARSRFVRPASRSGRRRRGDGAAALLLDGGGTGQRHPRHPRAARDPEDVRTWLADWDTTGLWRDGRLLGMVRTRRAGDDLHIGRLAVAPDLRGSAWAGGCCAGPSRRRRGAGASSSSPAPPATATSPSTGSRATSHSPTHRRRAWSAWPRPSTPPERGHSECTGGRPGWGAGDAVRAQPSRPAQRLLTFSWAAFASVPLMSKVFRRISISWSASLRSW